MSLTHLGLIKTTLLDYPGRVAATLFTPGCNLKCPYCHNPEFIDPQYLEGLIPLKEIHHFLKKRASLLTGVVITGGEPLIHGDDLVDLAHSIRDLGLKVKLDTNGTLPGRLAGFPADFIAMDLKTSPSKYPLLGYDGQAIEELLKGSLNYIKESGIDHQIRCTVSEELLEEEDCLQMLPLLRGVQQFRLTAFRSGKVLDPLWEQKKSPSSQKLEELRDFFQQRGIPTIVE